MNLEKLKKFLGFCRLTTKMREKNYKLGEERSSVGSRENDRIFLEDYNKKFENCFWVLLYRILIHILIEL